MHKYQIRFIRENRVVEAQAGTSLLQVQIDAGLQPDAPCGGRGTCGKCDVQIRASAQEEWQRVRACQTAVQSDLELLSPLPAQRAHLPLSRWDSGSDGGQLEDSMDGEGMMEAESLHKRHFSDMHELLRKEYPALLAIGAGTCKHCKQCSYPDEPCRFPDRMTSSMEAMGMLVLEVCKRNDLSYYYGPNTIAYTSCFLLK